MIVLCTLDILEYPLQSLFVLFIGYMFKPITLMNSKGNIWSCVL